MGPHEGVRFNFGLPKLAPIHDFPKEIPEPILITEAEAQQKLLEMGVRAPFYSLISCSLTFTFQAAKACTYCNNSNHAACGIVGSAACYGCSRGGVVGCTHEADFYSG